MRSVPVPDQLPAYLMDYAVVLRRLFRRLESSGLDCVDHLFETNEQRIKLNHGQCLLQRDLGPTNAGQRGKPAGNALYAAAT